MLAASPRRPIRRAAQRSRPSRSTRLLRPPLQSLPDDLSLPSLACLAIALREPSTARGDPLHVGTSRSRRPRRRARRPRREQLRRRARLHGVRAHGPSALKRPFAELNLRAFVLQERAGLLPCGGPEAVRAQPAVPRQAPAHRPPDQARPTSLASGGSDGRARGSRLMTPPSGEATHAYSAPSLSRRSALPRQADARAGLPMQVLPAGIVLQHPVDGHVHQADCTWVPPSDRLRPRAPLSRPWTTITRSSLAPSAARSAKISAVALSVAAVDDRHARFAPLPRRATRARRLLPAAALMATALRQLGWRGAARGTHCAAPPKAAAADQPGHATLNGARRGAPQRIEAMHDGDDLGARRRWRTPPDRHELRASRLQHVRSRHPAPPADRCVLGVAARAAPRAVDAHRRDRRLVCGAATSVAARLADHRRRDGAPSAHPPSARAGSVATPSAG